MEKINRSTRSLLISPFFILFILSILRNLNSYSQTDTTNIKKWEVGIYGGIFVPIYESTFRYSFGPSLTFKVEYNLSYKTSLYIRSEYSYIRGLNNFIFIVDEVPKVYARCIATTFGIKYHPFKSIHGFFTQLGIGQYYLEKQFILFEYGKYPYKYISNNFGINLGIGYEINILKDLKIEPGFLYNSAYDKIPGVTTYFSFYSGIDFKL